MHINFQMIVLICMAAISCMLGVSILQGKLMGPGAKTVSVMMFAGVVWLLAFAFEIGSPSYNTNRFWDTNSFSATILLPVVWLVFFLQFFEIVENPWKIAWRTQNREIVARCGGEILVESTSNVYRKTDINVRKKRGIAG
jgi:hypothetical protein